MVPLVRDDAVARARQSGEQRKIGGVAGIEKQRALSAFEQSEFAFQRFVQREIPREEPRASRAATELPNRLAACLDELGPRGEPQVVVRSQADQPTAATFHHRTYGLRGRR